jgi:hypothetical protein
MASDNEIRVGMSVEFAFGPQNVIGVVKEDRGNIGVGGRRLFLIKFEMYPGDNESQIELPAIEFEVLHHSPR